MNKIPVRHKWEPYLWLLPSTVLMTVFVIIPIIIVFRLSFSSISKSGVVGGFIALENFRDAFADPAITVVALNTVIWVFSIVCLATLTGFALAMALNVKFAGRKIVRLIVLLPWSTSLVCQAYVWNYIINYEYGSLNNVLLNLGFVSHAVNFRPDYHTEFIWECGVGIFVTVPFVCFTVLAALQSIDNAYYEAATVDGAGFWSKLRHVTIPLVKPALTATTVTNIIYVFNSFTIIYTMTKGAPANKTDIMVTLLYMRAFYDNQKGVATALSVIGFVALCIVAAIYMIITMRREDD